MTNLSVKTQPQAPDNHLQKLIQLTDCHLLAGTDTEFKGIRPYHTLETVCRQIAQQHPDTQMLLLTGDLSQDESLESYRHLRLLLEPFNIPVYALPGNHDNPAQMLAAFANTIGLVKSITLAHWKIYLLDSTVAGVTGGELAEIELEQLQQQLNLHPDTPSLIALHHHPVAISSDWMDRLGLRNSNALQAILHRHKQVRAVLFGHIHQEFQYRDEHILYLGTPATCIQFTPRSRDYALDTRPPGYRVLNLHADGMFHSHTEYLAD